MGLADLVIGISGNIGAGKTTLIEAAMDEEFKDILLSTLDNNPSATRKITSLKEDADFAILDKYYHDQERWAFETQVNFFNGRLEREKEVEVTKGIVLIDRPIEEDYHIFGKAQHVMGYMNDEAFNIYAKLFRHMMDRIPQPDIYVHLKSSIGSLQEKIKHRSIESEKELVSDSRYLEVLENLYHSFFRDHVRRKVVEIDADKIKLDKNGNLDKEYIKYALTKIRDEVNSLNIPKLNSTIGKWYSLEPTKAVEESIKLGNKLREYLQENKIVISIAGNIGLGKTSLAKLLANDLYIKGIYELDGEKDDITDELLSKYLADKSKGCYDLQRHLLDKRIDLRNKSSSTDSSCVEDRTPEEDPAVFHKHFRKRGYLTSTELDLLSNASRNAYLNSRPSDLMIVLHGTAESSMKQIIQRGRLEEIEGGWDLDEDLRPLAKLYQDFPRIVKEYGLHKGPVISLNVDEIDITSKIDQGFIYEQILTALKK